MTITYYDYIFFLNFSPAYRTLLLYILLHHLLPVWFCRISFSYLMNSTIFEKGKSTGQKKVCSVFLYYILTETFLIPGRTEEDIVTNAPRCACKVPLILYNCRGN